MISSDQHINQEENLAKLLDMMAEAIVESFIQQGMEEVEAVEKVEEEKILVKAE